MPIGLLQEMPIGELARNADLVEEIADRAVGYRGNADRPLDVRGSADLA
jgi:hypothetical protein